MGALCGGPAKDAPVDTNKDSPAQNTAPKKETESAESLAENQAEKEAEERKRQEAEKKKNELDAKFTDLCKEFVGLLSGTGEVTVEDLKTVYGDKAEKLMQIADHNEDNSLSIDETKTLFMKNQEPDCELVMQAIERISLVKDIREKRKKKEEQEAKRKAFEDACGEFVDVMKSDLDDTITEEELKLVCKKPFEKYAGVLYETEVRTTAGVMDAFTDGENFETTEVIEMTEAFKQIKKIRASEKDFDAKLDAFFGEMEGMDVVELENYFKGNTKEVFDKLDENKDGKVDRDEMKPMFRLENGYFDVDRLQSVRDGLGQAAAEQHKAQLEQAKKEFLSEVAACKEILTKATTPIELDELKKIMPDNADTYISLCMNEASDEQFMKAFDKGESFDKAGLVLVKEAINQVLEIRVKQFEERLEALQGKLVQSWLDKMDVGKLAAECADHEKNYKTIAAGESKKNTLDADKLKSMFVVDGVPQIKAFNVIYEALTEIENKAMKKFNKNMNELIKFIGEYCLHKDMGKFKRQDVFQVYIDETRVGDFDKRWVKKMLNKPLDDLPDKPELRQLFTNKKTKEPDPKLVKGFLSSLKTITDRRRLSIKQSNLLLDAEYEAQLLRLIGIIDDDIANEDQRETILTAVGTDKAPVLIRQIKAAHNGRLKLEQVKPLWIIDKKQDMTGLADFTNMVIAKIEELGGHLKEDEEEVEAADAKRDPKADPVNEFDEADG